MISKNLSLSLCLIAFMLACDGSKEDEIAKNQDMSLQEKSHDNEFRRVLDQLSPLFEKICMLDPKPKCLSNLKINFATIKASFDASYQKVDLSKLDSCIEKLDTGWQESIIRYLQDCDLLLPNQDENDFCLDDLDCKSKFLTCSSVWREDDLCVENLCIYDPYEDPYYGDPTYPKVGEDCTITLECEFGASCISQNNSYYCVDHDQIYVIQENEVCDPQVENLKCLQGLFCVTEYTNSPNSYCKSLANEGDTCYFTQTRLGENSNCAEGLHCEFAKDSLIGICKVKVDPSNEPCGRDGNDVTFCDSDQLFTCQNSTCKPISFANEYCQTDADCSHVINVKCIDQICQSIISENACVD